MFSSLRINCSHSVSAVIFSKLIMRYLWHRQVNRCNSAHLCACSASAGEDPCVGKCLTFGSGSSFTIAWRDRLLLLLFQSLKPLNKQVHFIIWVSYPGNWGRRSLCANVALLWASSGFYLWFWRASCVKEECDVHKSVIMTCHLCPRHCT